MRGTPVRTLASTIRARICAIIVRTCTDRAIICATTARMHMVHARMQAVQTGTVAVPRMDREQDRVRRTTAADDSVPPHPSSSFTPEAAAFLF